MAASRIAVALAAALLGFLGVVAASQPREVPSRGLGRVELVDLIRRQDGRVRELRRDVADLRRRVDRVARSVPASTGLEERIDRLSIAAGGAGLEGPGLVLTLDDSEAETSPNGDPNALVVHERDIQTAVNALWAAGAEAVAINDERLSTLSAVRCAGNTLLLHGTLQPTPYRIEAIGDPVSMREALLREPGMDRLLEAARTFGIQLDVAVEDVSIRGGVPLPAVTVAGPAR